MCTFLRQDILSTDSRGVRSRCRPAPLLQCPPPAVVLPLGLGNGEDVAFERRKLVQFNVVALKVSQETLWVVGQYYHLAGGGGFFL